MRRADPLVADTSLSVPAALPGVSAGCRAHLSEVARVEWRATDAGWAGDLEAFLADHGLPVRDLTRPAADAHARVCGAAVLLSAAAGAALVGSPARPSPAQAVPDVVAVVYGPGRRATRPPRPGPWRVGAWEPGWSVAEHAAAVAAVREAIGRGDVYQVNVVGHASAAYLGDPVAALHRLGSVPGIVPAPIIMRPSKAVSALQNGPVVGVIAPATPPSTVSRSAAEPTQGSRKLLEGAIGCGAVQSPN